MENGVMAHTPEHKRFAQIDFRDSPIGRQAYIQGSRLAVWQVVLIARSYDMDVKQTAEYLEWQEDRVQAALDYAKAFAEEIDAVISESASCDFERISRLLPQATQFTVED